MNCKHKKKLKVDIIDFYINNDYPDLNLPHGSCRDVHLSKIHPKNNSLYKIFNKNKVLKLN